VKKIKHTVIGALYQWRFQLSAMDRLLPE